ncbi:hypothetical protein CR513_09082, partial [Mucuna pruriens]
MELPPIFLWKTSRNFRLGKAGLESEYRFGNLVLRRSIEFIEEQDELYYLQHTKTGIQVQELTIEELIIEKAHNEAVEA